MKKLLTIMLSVAFILSACAAEVDPESLETDQADQGAAVEFEEEPAEAEETQQTEKAEEENEAKEQEESTASTEPEEEKNTDSGEAAASEDSDEGTEEPEEDTVEASGDETSSEEETKEEQTSNVGMKAYMPKEPMTKTFMQNDEYEAVYEIVDIQGNYVQQVITFGDMVTLQVLEWTEGTVSVVYEEYNPEDTASMLDGFEPVETVNVLMDVTQSSQSDSSFKLIDENQTTSTPVREFENVLVVQKIEKADSSGAEVRSTFHYAPDYGLIKEKVEDKGENGYTMNSELIDIK
ncbi:DUF4050 domain-containing protein [Halobacillus faecis]|uniref:Lipoprotein n=1 Tax=Halobacillus faecis TaxID=360184 RepID=A0A511WYH5_9BACI|nr:DUF4050 domain-containing protein [Halobacillus faecis]GEN54652.1 hypothetical protein HFA01_29140 [Halobacillus faecis]